MGDGGNRAEIGGCWRKHYRWKSAEIGGYWGKQYRRALADMVDEDFFGKKMKKVGKKFGSFGIFLYLCKWKDEGGGSCRMTSKAIFFLFC